MTFRWNWLFAVFGIGAWLEVNGIFAESWKLMEVVPEGPKILASLGLVVQVANIVPILVSWWTVDLRRAIITILAGGLASLILMATTWSYTVSISGTQVSLFVYMWTFCAASFDCLSNLFVWSYSARYAGNATVSMSVGQNFATLICYLISLIQKGLDFSVEVYFALIAVVATSSLFAFLSIRPPVSSEEDPLQRIECEPKPVHHWFAILAGLSFVQNGLMTSILYYASRKNFFYNNVPPSLVTPFSAMLAYKFTGQGWIFASCTVASLMGLVTVVLAAVRGIKEPRPSVPPSDWWDNALYTPLVFVGSNCLAYSKAAIFSRLPTDANWNNTDALMKRAGVFIQLGSFVGAFTFFLVVHV